MRFNILDLWTYTNDTFYWDPNNPDLTYISGYASLTKEACRRLAGPGMSPYDGSLIWTRATTWKFPLIQVFASFPRPPLNLKTEIFVLLHLLGDPIDSVQNLLLKISRCQKRVDDWKTDLRISNVPIDLREDHTRDDLEQSREEEQIYECHWKSLALVTDAYDEWDQADNQVNVMQRLLKETGDKKALLEVIQDASNALAADRATKYLPSLVALTSFIAIIGIAMGRTAASIDTPAFNTTVFINVEVHGVTFSALYFWIIPTLLFGSFIGVSQSEARIPRILNRLHDDLDRHFSKPRPHSKLGYIKDQVNKLRGYIAPKTDHRMFHGGIYSWQPSRAQYDTEAVQNQDDPSIPLIAPTGDGLSTSGNAQPPNPASNQTPQCAGENPAVQPNTANTQAPGTEGDDDPRPAMQTSSLLSAPAKQKPKFLSKLCIWLRHRFLSFLIVLIPTISSTIVSSRVPPDGWNCRVSSEVSIFLAWFLSAESDLLIKLIIPLRATNLRKIFWVTLAKDAFFAFGTIIWVLMTVIGALNRCDCWIDHDGVSLVLPQRHDIDILLRHRLNVDYPAWIFLGVAIELILIPGLVKCWYGGALKVFVQRDDGKSNVEWFWKGVDGTRRFVWWMKRKWGDRGRMDSGLSLRSPGNRRRWA